MFTSEFIPTQDSTATKHLSPASLRRVLADEIASILEAMAPAESLPGILELWPPRFGDFRKQPETDINPRYISAAEY